MPLPIASSSAPLANTPPAPNLFTTPQQPGNHRPAGNSMRKAYKYRIYPTRNQTTLLNQELAAAQSLYNTALEQRRTAWKPGACPSATSTRQKSSRNSGQATSRHQPTSAPARTSSDASTRRSKPSSAGSRPDRSPDSRASGHASVTTRLPSPATATAAASRMITSSTCKASASSASSGTARYKARSRPSPCAAAPAAGHVCFSVEYEAEPLPVVDDEVGIDVGLEHFAALSNGDLIANPRWYKRAQRRLRRAQRKVARRIKGSNGRRKAVRELQRVHSKSQSTIDYAHKLARQVVDSYQLIAVEKLNIGGMSRGMLAKQVHDAGCVTS